jgi:RHS repeat-associated protein
MNPGFATYHNDCSSGLEYAMNRYYDPARGRFTTPDPYGGSAVLTDPLSFNKYAYALADPINRNDSSGLNAEAPGESLDNCGPNWVVDASLSGPCADNGDYVEGGFIGPIAPNPATITLSERMRREAVILANMFLLFKRIRQSGATTQIWPAAIQIMSICPSTFGLSKTTNVTYQILDENGNPMSGTQLLGDSISESFWFQTGNMDNLNSSSNRQTWKYLSPTAPIYANGQFIDTLGTNKPFNSNISGAAVQEFTATGGFGTQALDIIMGGVSYSGANFNVYSSNGATVNGVASYNCK